MTHSMTRRDLLAAALSLPLAAAPGLAAADDLRPGLQARLKYLMDAMSYDLTGIPGVETKVFKDHARLRIPAAALFAPGKSYVSREGVVALTALAPAIRAAQGLNVEIVGHIDGTTHSFEGYMISRRRAESVKAVLLSRKVPDTMPIVTTGLGDLYPIASHDGPQAVQNNRIEIILRGA